MAEAFGSDEGTPTPRESAFRRVDCVSCGLPPLFPLDGTDTGDVFAGGKDDLGKMLFELFLRSASGVGGTLPPLGLVLEVRLSRMLFISDGMDTEWTMLTECQSAAWI
jgi:hypothetical protein